MVDRIEQALCRALGNDLVGIKLRFFMFDKDGAAGHILLPRRGFGKAKDIVMAVAIGDFEARNDAEIRLIAKVWIRVKGIVVGDGEKVHPFPLCQGRQFWRRERAVRMVGMRVEITAVPPRIGVDDAVQIKRE